MTTDDIGFTQSNATEDEYTDFPADKDHFIKTAINSTFDSPIRKLEEHIDNAKDAEASSVTVLLSTWSRFPGFGCEDDGKGIPDGVKVVKFGSDHKEIEAEQDATLDITGKFGEGAKGSLSIADFLDYYSNYGGPRDTFVRLRTPNKYPMKKCVLVRDEPAGSCKPTVGTRVYAYPVESRIIRS